MLSSAVCPITSFVFTDAAVGAPGTVGDGSLLGDAPGWASDPTVTISFYSTLRRFSYHK